MNLKMSQKNAVVKFFLGVLYFLEHHEFPWDFSDNLLNPTNKYLSGEFRADSYDKEIAKALAYDFKEIITGERTTNHTFIDQSKGIVLKMERTNGVLNPCELFFRCYLICDGEIMFTSDDFYLGPSNQLIEFAEKISPHNDKSGYNAEKVTRLNDNLRNDDAEDTSVNNVYLSKQGNNAVTNSSQYKNEIIHKNEIHIKPDAQPDKNMLAPKEHINTLIKNNPRLQVFSDLIENLFPGNKPSRMLLMKKIAMGNTSCNINDNEDIHFNFIGDYLLFYKKHDSYPFLNEAGTFRIDETFQLARSSINKNIDKVTFIEELALVFFALSSEDYFGTKSQSIFSLRMFGTALLDYALKITKEEINNNYDTYKIYNRSLTHQETRLSDYLRDAINLNMNAQILVGHMIEHRNKEGIHSIFEFHAALYGIFNRNID